MAIKKFLISTGDGDVEESELDSSGQRTIGYDDTAQRVQLSKAYVVGDLYVSGTIYGNLNGNATGGGSSNSNFVSLPRTYVEPGWEVIPPGVVMAIGPNGVQIAKNDDNLLSNVVGVFHSTGSSNLINVQITGEAFVVTDNNFTTGTVLYLSDYATATNYSSITSGKYITQIGYTTGIYYDNGIPVGNTVILQPRIFGVKG